MERTVATPVGTLKIEGDDRAITGIWLNTAGAVTTGGATGVLAELERQLAAYFSGSLKTFDLAIAPKGTPFQLEVWSALQNIPYGASCSYSDIARKIGRSLTRAAATCSNSHTRQLSIPQWARASSARRR